MSDNKATAACGHDSEQFVTADEGTGYCPACENEARNPAPDARRFMRGLMQGGVTMRPPPKYDGKSNMEFCVPGSARWIKDAWPEIQRLQAKLNRLREDYETRIEWASNQKDCSFAEQIGWDARARLNEWDRPLEEWEP